MITSILPCLYINVHSLYTSESVGRQHVMVCLGLVEGDCVAYPFLHVFLALRLEKAFLSWSYWLLEQGGRRTNMLLGLPVLQTWVFQKIFSLSMPVYSFLSLPQIKANKNLSTAKIPNKQKKDYPVSLLEIKEQNSTCSGLTCMHYLACEFSRMRSQSPNHLHHWWTAWRILRSSHLEYMAGWWKLLQLRGWWPPWQGLHHINKLPCYGDEM